MFDYPIVRRELIRRGMSLGLAALSPSLSAAEPKEAGAPTTQLTLHAIDTYFGQTHAGLIVDLSRLEGGAYKKIKTVETEPRGRTKEPLLIGDEVVTGRYELLLHLDTYFKAHAAQLPQPPFLAKVPIRFGIYTTKERFHVPILFSPWSYSYYRGS